MNLARQGVAQPVVRAISRNRLTITLRLPSPHRLAGAGSLGAAALRNPLRYRRALVHCLATMGCRSNVRSLGLDFRGLLRESWLLGATLALAAVVLAVAYFSGSLHRLWGLRHPRICNPRLCLLGLRAGVHVAVLLPAHVARPGLKGQRAAPLRSGLCRRAPAQSQPDPCHLLCWSGVHGHLRPQAQSVSSSLSSTLRLD